MSKPVKNLITEALRERYAGVRDVCVVDLTGLDVARTHQLRNELRSKSIRLHVVKNSMARRAFAGGPLEALGARLEGPCALVTGGESIIEVAKTLVHWAKQLGNVGLKEAVVDGDSQLLPVEQVARLKGRRELLGELAMLIASPGRSLAGCISGPARRVAGCVKTLADRKEEGPQASGGGGEAAGQQPEGAES